MRSPSRANGVHTIIARHERGGETGAHSNWPATGCSWTPEEPQIESYKHQGNTDVHCQPFPESVSEEREINTDDDRCHRHHVKDSNHLSAHVSFTPFAL